MSNREKIMMYSSVHIWKDARIFFKEAKSLSKVYDVDFYAIGEPGAADKYETEHLRIHLLPKRSRLKRYKNWKILLKEIKNSEAKFFHYHDPELLILMPIIRNKKDRLFIYDMHENFPKSLEAKDWIPRVVKKPLIRMINYIEKKLIKLNDTVIYAEKSYKEDYTAVSPYVSECDIYNYPYASLPNAKKEKVDTDSIQFVYIGRVAVVRGVWEMLHAVEKVAQNSSRKIKLKLIGQCEKELLGDIEKYIYTNKLNDIVEYLPFVEYDTIWEVYGESDIGLCLLHPTPNYVGSIATKMFEYMAAGLPMIVSNFPLWKQVVAESENGLLVDPLDELSIQYAMEQLIDDPILRQQYSKRGEKQYQQSYNWDNEEKKLLDLYEQMKK